MENHKEWKWPGNLARYDRDPALSRREKEQIAYLVTRHVGSGAGPWPENCKAALVRLIQPVREVLNQVTKQVNFRHHAIRALLKEMHRRGRPYWSWSGEEWLATVGPTNADFLRRHGCKMVTHRQPIFSVAYLLGGFTDFEGFPPHGIEIASLADSVFGREMMKAAVDTTFGTLHEWGYNHSMREKIRTALSYLFLTNRSPNLGDLNVEFLEMLNSKRQTTYGLPHLYAISRALAHLKIIRRPIPSGRAKVPLLERVDTDGIAAEWVDWCFAWYRQSGWTPRSRKHGLFKLLQIGRWLDRVHPEVTKPEHWDYSIAADFVAAVDEMKVGDWCSRRKFPACFKPPVGKPLTPRGKAGFLHIARTLFLDLHDLPIRVGTEKTVRTLARRFNPLRAFRVPPAIYRLIGPAPRIIDDKLWLKLLHAAESLEKSDLRSFQLGMYPFELVQAVAATWCLSGLRGDEIRRLRIGCIRWRAEESVARDGTESSPNDALCFLSVPVNKTGTAFTKPVHWVVGKRIEAWERVRPAQTLSLDAKTNEMVNFLFSFRGIRIAPEYINGHVIPLLCAKANIPLRDAMGKITAHRARATIASALYNAPEGLGIGELGQWLGHKDMRSTQYYAKLHPTRLAKSISRANKNSRLIQVLVDPAAIAKGEPAIFYYLGNEAYCANPAWASCPHRLACLKCPMYVPKETAQLIDARDGVLRLMQEVPLTDEEKSVAEGDAQALTRYIEGRRHVPTPQLPSPRYNFNSSMQTAEHSDSSHG
jgi:integrase